MNITKRLYTYPVLSEERDDYIDSVFDADVQYKMNGVNNLLFDFDIEMDNKDLQNMILEGDAEYVIHIECANTEYSCAVKPPFRDAGYRRSRDGVPQIV